MNAKELLTKEHIGRMLVIRSKIHGTRSTGIFQGIRISEWNGSDGFYFINGMIGETPQDMFQIPVKHLFDIELLDSCEIK